MRDVGPASDAGCWAGKRCGMLGRQAMRDVGPASDGGATTRMSGSPRVGARFSGGGTRSGRARDGSTRIDSEPVARRRSCIAPAIARDPSHPAIRIRAIMIRVGAGPDRQRRPSLVTVSGCRPTPVRRLRVAAVASPRAAARAWLRHRGRSARPVRPLEGRPWAVNSVGNFHSTKKKKKKVINHLADPLTRSAACPCGRLRRARLDHDMGVFFIYTIRMNIESVQ
jgi:hypothetical protein